MNEETSFKGALILTTAHLEIQGSYDPVLTLRLAM